MEIPSSLEMFKSNNESISIELLKDKYLIRNPWNDSSIHLLFKKDDNYELLRNIILPEELVAIYHKSESKLEVIAGPIFKDHSLFNRVFEFNYNGNIYKCFADQVTSELKYLAEHFVIADTFTSSYHRNLPMLRDYFTQRMPKKFIEETVPISFFIVGNFFDFNWDFIPLLKHINFYMTYFERSSPTIIILDKKEEFEKFKTPCLYNFSKAFPNKINSQLIDPILLDIFSVAQETKDIRLKFIFFYQILEYSSYYYLNSKLKSKLSSILKSPDLPFIAADYIKIIVEELKDHFSQKDDYQKLELTILDYCSIDDFKYEIECNWEYFSEDQEFDGGFKMSKVLKDKDSIQTMIDSDLLKFVKNIDRIRNVIVHLRESRENKVILPTNRNNNLLSPYLFLLRRIAEKVAMRFS